MQVKRSDFSPELANIIETTPIDELEKIFKIQPKKMQPPSSQPSKWAQIVARNKEEPINLGAYTEEDHQHRQDFRENFEFYHDKK